MIIILISILLSFLVGIGSSYLIMKSKMRRESLEILNKLNIEAEEKITDAIYLERFRIARELHDDLIQRLSAIRLRIEHTLIYAERHEVIDDLERAKKNLEDSILEIRFLIEDNLQPGFYRHSLSRLIEKLCYGLDRMAGRKLTYKSAYREREFALHDTDRKELFRMVQQSVHNAVVHSLGDTTSVTVDWKNDLTISIADNGTGIIMKEKGIGSDSMQERAKKIGAELSRSSTINGVIITIKFPRPNSELGISN